MLRHAKAASDAPWGGGDEHRPLTARGRRDATALGRRLATEPVGFGFDVVDAGPLREGWRIQRDTPGYGPRRTAGEIRKDLAAAKRYADR